MRSATHTTRHGTQGLILKGCEAVTERSRVLILKTIVKLQAMFRLRLGGKKDGSDNGSFAGVPACGHQGNRYGVWRTREHPQRWYPLSDSGSVD
jgi:hypothetical protein